MQQFILYVLYRDDLDAIRRLCWEFCEDAAKQGIAYVEAR